jgi:adenine phosphoribosyltransferase
VVEKMVACFEKTPVDGVIAIESRGFLLGSCFSLARKIPLVLARKKGKLPGKTLEESYALEYGTATLQIHEADLAPGKKWLIIDDLIATGGTIEAVAKMVKRRGGEVAGVFGIIGLPFLNYEAKIGAYRPVTLINYSGE